MVSVFIVILSWSAHENGDTYGVYRTLEAAMQGANEYVSYGHHMPDFLIEEWQFDADMTGMWRKDGDDWKKIV
jgi:hypothetical protein